MKVKRVYRDDIKLVVKLFDRYREFYQQESDEALAEHFLCERLERNESVVFVALASGTLPVGFVQLYPVYSSVRVEKNWVLNDLYVEEGFRRQGLGGGLVRAALDFAQVEGSRFLQLETAVDNLNAQRLYASFGFEQQHSDAAFLLYRLKF